MSVPLGADRNNEVGWSRGMGRCIVSRRVGLCPTEVSKEPLPESKALLIAADCVEALRWAGDRPEGLPRANFGVPSVDGERS